MNQEENEHQVSLLQHLRKYFTFSILYELCMNKYDPSVSLNFYPNRFKWDLGEVVLYNCEHQWQ